jgi:hypothetical protein
MDLKKQTKAELISAIKNYQIKKLEQKLDLQKESNKNKFFNQIKSYFLQIWNLISTFKDILAKLTFISLLIGLFRKYKIFRRIWLILNSIVMGIFGISLLDNFGLGFLKNFITEIRDITYSVIDYLSNTQFYNYLNNLFNKEIPSSKKIDKSRPLIEENTTETIRNETSIRRNQGNPKISDWLKPNDEIIEEIPEETNYKKYIIIGTTIIIVSFLSWYFFDEIKASGLSVVEWIKKYFNQDPRDPRDPSNSDFKGKAKEKLDRLIKEKFKKDQEENVASSSKDPIDIYFPENEKRVLTSPSLEELNKNVSDSWDSEASSSSNSSDETITPFNSQKDNLFKNKLEDLSFFKEKWKILMDEDIKDNIQKYENILNGGFSEENMQSLIDIYVKLIFEYNENTKYLNELKNLELDSRNLEIGRQINYQFRNWIIENHKILLPQSDKIIETGNEIDSPQLLPKDLFED